MGGGNLGQGDGRPTWTTKEDGDTGKTDKDDGDRQRAKGEREGDN